MSTTTNPFEGIIDSQVFDAALSGPSVAIAPVSEGHIAKKLDRTLQAREAKARRLAGTSQYDLTNTRMEFEGAANESMANKVVNDYSPAELRAYEDMLDQEYGIRQIDDGSYLYNKTNEAVPQEELKNYASLYTFGSKQDGLWKVGTWGGLDPRDRYSPETLAAYKARAIENGYYQEPVLEDTLGVDRDKLIRNTLIPRDMRTLMEGLYHGSTQMQKYRPVRRLMGEDGTPMSESDYYKLKDAFGSGGTEFYSDAALEDVLPDDFDKITAWANFKEKYQLDNNQKATKEEKALWRAERAAALRNRIQLREAEEGLGFGGRAYQAVASIGKSLAGEVILHPADWLGEVTGLWDFGTEEEKAQMLNDAFGINPYVSALAVEGAKQNVAKAFTHYKETGELDTDSVLEALKHAAGAAPEMVGESIGYVLSFVLPAGWLGKLTKVGKRITDVEKSLRAGKMTRDEAKTAVKKIRSEASMVENLISYAPAGVVFAVMTGNKLNSLVEERKENLVEGEELTSSDILNMVPLATASTAIDLLADRIILKDLPGIRNLLKSPAQTAVKEAKDAPASLYKEMADKTVIALKGLGAVGKDIGLESLQEYTVTVLDTFNTQYATAKYGKDFGAIFNDTANQIEALTSGLLGATTGAAMSGVNYAGSLSGNSLNATLSLIEKATNAKRSTSTSGLEEGDTAPVAAIPETQMQEYKAAFKTNLTELVKDTTLNTVNADNVASVAERLAEITALREVIASESDPKALESMDELIADIEVQVLQVIKDSGGNIQYTPAQPANKKESVATVQQAVNNLFPNIDTSNHIGVYSTLEEAYKAANIDPTTTTAGKVSFSLRAVEAQNALGTTGIPATHSSTRLFDQFNWRDHSGKATGSMKQGAGVYFSTGERSADFYKEYFSNHLKRQGVDGNLYSYQVSLDITPENTLKWKQTLPAQGARIQEVVNENPELFMMRDQGIPTSEKSQAAQIKELDLNAYTGEFLYRSLAENLGSMQAASDYLAAKGIPAAEVPANFKEDGPNYVVYDTNAIQVNAVDTTEVPKFSKESKNVQQAFTYNGKVYLVANNMDLGSAQSVIMHEVGVHLAKMDKRLDKHYNKLLDALKELENSNDKNTRNIINAARSRTNKAVGNQTDKNSKLWNEEFLAYVVEESVAAGIVPRTKGTLLEEFLAKVVGFFKSALKLVYDAQNGTELAKTMVLQDVVDLAHGYAVATLSAEAREQIVEARKSLEPKESDTTTAVEETDLQEEAKEEPKSSIKTDKTEDSDTSENTSTTAVKGTDRQRQALIEQNEAIRKAPKIKKLTAAQIKARQEAVIESLVESAVSASKGKVDQTLRDSLYKVAETNKVKKAKVDRIIKSYKEVEEEASMGNRSYRAYNRQLTILLTSNTVDDVRLQNLYDRVTDWYKTSLVSVQQLQDGITAANEKAATLRAQESKIKHKKDVVKVTTDYTKEDGKPYVITVSKKSGSWIAHTDDAQKRIDAKKQTVANLKSLLGRFSREARPYLQDSGDTFSEAYLIPSSSSETVRREQNYIQDVEEAVSELKGYEATVNKIILSDKHAPWWDTKTARATNNAHLINSLSTSNTEYTSEDTVLVHSLDSIPIKNTKNHVSGFYRKDGKDTAANEIKAAMEAGATIVLDYSVRYAGQNNQQIHHGKTKEAKKQGFTAFTGYNIHQFLTSNGYVPAGVNQGSDTVSSNIYVPATSEAQARYDKQKEELAEKKEQLKKRASLIKRLEDWMLKKRAVELRSTYTYDEAKIDQAIAEIRAELLPFFEAQALRSLQREAAEAQQSGDTFLTADDVTEATAEAVEGTESDIEMDVDDFTVETIDMPTITLDDLSNRKELNLSAFINRRVDDLIESNKNYVRAEAQKKNPEAVEFADPALALLVETSLASDEAASIAVTSTMGKIAKAIKDKVRGTELFNFLAEAVKEIGLTLVGENAEKETGTDIKAKEHATNIINNAIGSSRTTKIFKMSGYGIPANAKPGDKHKPVYLSTHRFENTLKKIGDTIEITNNNIRYKVEVSAIDEVSINPSEYLKAGKLTPLNTLPVESLPKVFQEVLEASKKAFKDAVQPLQPREKTIDTDRSDGKEGYLYAYDSPARNLIFDAEGNVNDALVLSMGLAINDLIRTESFKLLRRPKDKQTVAEIFRVREEEVTDEMVKVASENGVLAKGLADSLGKAALGALGISNKHESEVSRGTYTRLVSDLGNMMIEMADKQGLLALTPVSSNVLAKMYKGGEVTADEGQQTWFVHMTDKEASIEGSKRKFKVRSDKAEFAATQAAEVEKLVPDIIGKRKTPSYKRKVSDKTKQQIINQVRNDIIGAKVPPEAQETLIHYMDTKYRIDLRNVEDFFNRFDSSSEAEKLILQQLGHIEISEENPEFVKLLADDKLKQEAINERIIKSIEHLREAYELAKEDPANAELYFEFFYSTNQRYSIDSNTINPQADKLHRFLITPDAHYVTYNVNRKNHTFTHIGKDGVERDASLYVRAALAQAFGIGIDKTNTLEIIRVGNALLSLDVDSIASLRQQLYSRESANDKLNIEVKTDKGWELIELESEHLSHTLQALTFLEDYKSSTATTLTSNLAAETDALTSGYSNKMQQFGTIGQFINETNEILEEHLRRIGLIQDTKQGHIQDIHNMLKQGDSGLNDMLAQKDYLDSYKSLGKEAITKIAGEAALLPSSESDVFKAIKNILPGGESIGANEIKIDSKLRNLFKSPFMIFNYSASVARIVKELSSDVSKGMLSQVSAMDVETEATKDTDLYKAAVQFVSLTTGKKIADVKKADVLAFQERLRTEDLSQIKTNKKVKDTRKSESSTDSMSIEQYLADKIITPTYGKAVEDTFNEQFKDFLAIQDATNDMFQASFAVFNTALGERVIQYRKEEGNRIITEETMLGFVQELAEVFPLIGGPLSTMLMDGIGIYEVDTRTPPEYLSTIPDTKSKLVKTSANTRSRKVNPLLKSITAAANKGSVLPFHGLDGAELSSATLDYIRNYVDKILGTDAGILPIHDAAIVPLILLDAFAYSYNKQTAILNQTYSIMGEINELADRMTEVLNTGQTTTGLEVKLEDIKKLGIAEKRKLVGKEHASFKEELAYTINQVRHFNDKINEARSSEIFKEGSYLSAMVGLGGSVLSISEAEGTIVKKADGVATETTKEMQERLKDLSTDLTFSDRFESFYEDVDVRVSGYVPPTSSTGGTDINTVIKQGREGTADIETIDTTDFLHPEDATILTYANHLIANPASASTYNKAAAAYKFAYGDKKTIKTNDVVYVMAADNVANAKSKAIANEKNRAAAVEALDEGAVLLFRSPNVRNEAEEALLNAITAGRNVELYLHTVQSADGTMVTMQVVSPSVLENAVVDSNTSEMSDTEREIAELLALIPEEEESSAFGEADSLLESIKAKAANLTTEQISILQQTVEEIEKHC